VTTPKLIDGGKSPPCPHHPAVRSETMTERRRCLALLSREIQVRGMQLDNASTKLRREKFEYVLDTLTQIRTRIESGEQP
jgi:hypothetical protein